MPKHTDWFDRLIALAALVWTFGTPWVGMKYIRPEQTILGIWFVAGWFLGIYAFCKIAEGLERSKSP
jgi:hypothetical protein